MSHKSLSFILYISVLLYFNFYSFSNLPCMVVGYVWQILWKEWLLCIRNNDISRGSKCNFWEYERKGDLYVLIHSFIWWLNIMDVMYKVDPLDFDFYLQTIMETTSLYHMSAVVGAGSKKFKKNWCECRNMYIYMYLIN